MTKPSELPVCSVKSLISLDTHLATAYLRHFIEYALKGGGGSVGTTPMGVKRAKPQWKMVLELSYDLNELAINTISELHVYPEIKLSS